mmetsp:Transcript_24581/g.24858  ORF Transcript_24581/g.24858 Transcript_24581/m.24858 type:complete len:83 (+) Transcript_24581:1208-1456(+)
MKFDPSGRLERRIRPRDVEQNRVDRGARGNSRKNRRPGVTMGSTEEQGGVFEDHSVHHQIHKDRGAFANPLFSNSMDQRECR